MTQESQDGIPLRFKGIVIFRIAEPAVAARLFDFSDRSGLESIRGLIGHICLGELRAVVAHMTMEQCIEERKTSLTDAVEKALQQVVHDPERGWGIDLQVVQVAQVFIVEDEVRRQLEAEVRNQIKSRSELAELQAQETISLAQLGSERRIQQEGLETEKQRIDLAREKLYLQKELEREEIEAEAPLRLLKLEKQNAELKAEQEVRQLENQVKALTVENEMMAERATQELRKEILPLEQMPVIAKAVSSMFQGTNLSLYGEGAPLLSALAPLVELVGNALRESRNAMPVSEN